MSTAEGGLQVPLCKLIARCVEGIIYAVRKKPYMGAFFWLFLGLLCGPEHTGGQSLGVCYGGSGNGNNLPSESEAVSLCKTNGIERMRIYSPYTEILRALSGTEIDLIVGVPNDSLEALADASAAADWVQSNIKDYSSNVKFRYIAVGNEVNPTGSTAPFVLPAMQNVYKAIADAGLQNQIQVSTAVDTNLLGVFDPPSAGAFSDDAKPFIEPIIAFLVSNGAPLLANIYPYFRVKFNNQSVPYALFTAQGTVVQDGQLDYQNLFDALMDALYSALEKTNGESLAIVMSESGWPSAGGAVETLENAGTYYRNLINHVKGGTPKRPGNAIETYLFGLFDENLKDPEIERNFGLFYPDKQPKYKISFG